MANGTVDVGETAAAASARSQTLNTSGGLSVLRHAVARYRPSGVADIHTAVAIVVVEQLQAVRTAPVRMSTMWTVLVPRGAQSTLVEPGGAVDIDVGAHRSFQAGRAVNVPNSADSVAALGARR